VIIICNLARGSFGKVSFQTCFLINAFRSSCSIYTLCVWGVLYLATCHDSGSVFVATCSLIRFSTGMIRTVQQTLTNKQLIKNRTKSRKKAFRTGDHQEIPVLLRRLSGLASFSV
jgi:hypothetical protein